LLLLKSHSGCARRWTALAPSQRQPLHWPAANAALQLSLSVHGMDDGQWGWSCDVEVAAEAESLAAPGSNRECLLSETLVKVKGGLGCMYVLSNCIED